jgi:hypothetical protein
MFFIQKALETIVISSALVHASVSRRVYIINIGLFTVSAFMSTLAAYEIVSPTVPVLFYENQLFQLLLGASGGVLMFLAVYFHYIEARRMQDEVTYKRNPYIMMLAYVIFFSLSVLTGFFG